jgi:hypothetical protein
VGCSWLRHSLRVHDFGVDHWLLRLFHCSTLSYNMHRSTPEADPTLSTPSIVHNQGPQQAVTSTTSFTWSTLVNQLRCDSSRRHSYVDRLYDSTCTKTCEERDAVITFTPTFSDAKSAFAAFSSLFPSFTYTLFVMWRR